MQQKELIQKVWHTELETVTNENGTVDFRGFYGKYEITVNGKTYSANLCKADNNPFTIVI